MAARAPGRLSAWLPGSILPRVDSLRLYRRAAGAVWCHIVANDHSNGNTDEVNVDIQLLDESGGVILIGANGTDIHGSGLSQNRFTVSASTLS